MQQQRGGGGGGVAWPRHLANRNEMHVLGSTTTTRCCSSLITDVMNINVFTLCGCNRLKDCVTLSGLPRHNGPGNPSSE